MSPERAAGRDISVVVSLPRLVNAIRAVIITIVNLIVLTSWF